MHVDCKVCPGCADSHEDRIERHNTKRPSIFDWIYMYMNIYKYTCIKVDGTMYTTELCTCIHIYTYQHCICVNVYMYIYICSNGKYFVLQESLEARCWRPAMSLFLSTINLHLPTIRFDSFFDSILTIQNNWFLKIASYAEIGGGVSIARDEIILANHKFAPTKDSP